MHDEVAYSIHEADIKPITGTHALVLLFKSDKPEDRNSDLLNLEWFVFEDRKK
jgi:hypothetical protein